MTDTPKTAADVLLPTSNLNVESIRSIIPPGELCKRIPMSTVANKVVVEGRKTVQNILDGTDPRLLVVIGPCSVHDVDAAREYAEKLKVLCDRVADQMYVVMRVYFEKPRTTVGWKGLINDPHLNGTFDMATGFTLGRQLLNDVNNMGLPCGTELLDPIVPQYIGDLVTWAAIGARTTESQTHRQMASGLSMPVGYKNSTDGSIQIAIDALKAAGHSHHFLGIDEEGKICVVKTRGNRYGHIILRGGAAQTNFDEANVAAAADKLTSSKLLSKLMVDCSHANSSKKHENQAVVWDSVIEQKRAGGKDCPIMGMMVESNLFEGRQDIPTDLSQLKHGVSVTDACIGWDVTEKLLLAGAKRLK